MALTDRQLLYIRNGFRAARERMERSEQLMTTDLELAAMHATKARDALSKTLTTLRARERNVPKEEDTNAKAN